VRNVREDWDERFSAMAADCDDQLMDEESATSAWDETEWQW
jgi:hypothetical protein